MSRKLKSVKRLMASKFYVLVTDKEAFMEGKYSGKLDSMMILHSLSAARKHLDKIIKRVEKDITDGRNVHGRQKSRPDKPG